MPNPDQSKLSSHRAVKFVVRIGTCGQSIEYAPYYIAKSKGWITEALAAFGAGPEHRIFESPAQIMEALSVRYLDFIFEPEASAIVERSLGHAIKIISVSSSSQQEILVRKNAGIEKVSDLKDKKIAVVTGSSSHYVLLKLLDGAWLLPRDVKLINMTASEAYTAFVSDEVDAWAICSPAVEEQELTGSGIAFGAGSSQVQSILAARTNFILEQAGICQAMVNVLDRAKHWIIDHIAEAQEIVSSEIPTPLEVVQKAFAKHNWKTHLHESVVSDIQAKADFLKSHNMITMPVNVRASLLDSSFTSLETKTLPMGVQAFPIKANFPLS